MNALLIIDLQNDFCPGGSLAVPDGDAIIPVVNKLAAHFSLVAATKDWHPQEHVSFSETHQGSEIFDTVSVHGLEQMLWPVHCVQGSKGAELHPDLNLNPIDLILHKGTRQQLDSYSAFFENDGTTPTGLQGWLKDFGVTHVYVCGLAEDVCVFHSAVDAHTCGFVTTVISDATRAVDTPKGSAERTRAELKALGIHSMPHQQAITELQTASK